MSTLGVGNDGGHGRFLSFVQDTPVFRGKANRGWDGGRGRRNIISGFDLLDCRCEMRDKVWEITGDDTSENVGPRHDAGEVLKFYGIDVVD